MFDALSAFTVDTATATSKGGREYQEDAVLTDFAVGADVGFAVLADGMGGHAAGDIASKIVVTVMFSELSFRRAQLAGADIPTHDLLMNAAETANQCIADYVSAHPQAAGMGATLVAVVVYQDQLRWISIGDSPLYLFRDGRLSQLNADHSLAAQIDLLMHRGMLTPEEAENHPDRNVLTSVLMGDNIGLVDVPVDPMQLAHDDVIIVASDGLQALPNRSIEAFLQSIGDKTSKEIASELMQEVKALENPNLDNVSFSVIRVYDNGQSAQRPESGIGPREPSNGAPV